jgi:hypothetical protein
VIVTVVTDVAGNPDSGYFLVFISAAFVFGIVIVVEVDFDRTAFDDDVTTVCHGSFSFEVEKVNTREDFLGRSHTSEPTTKQKATLSASLAEAATERGQSIANF